MSINLPHVKGTRKNLWRMLINEKIRSTFYTESTLRKLLCKPEGKVATEDKKKIVYEIDFSYRKAVYFGEHKRSQKICHNEPKRSVRNCDCEKNKFVKYCWEADHNFS